MKPRSRFDLRAEIARAYRAGEFQERLDQYCRQWRDNHSEYALRHIVDILVRRGEANELFAVLCAPDFRERYRIAFGIDALRGTLQLGLTYFSEIDVDLLRYIKLLFLEEMTVYGDPGDVRRHQDHAREFEEFLQLDVPMRERASQGLHRILSAIVPRLLVRPAHREKRRTHPRIKLVGYNLGTWKCRCGKLSSHLYRYVHLCACGNLRGSGRLPVAQGEICPKCESAVQYLTCSECHTRVTLDLLWALPEGHIHPSACYVDLTLKFRKNRRKGEPHYFLLRLMKVPLLLGIAEKEGRIVFTLPDAMWLGGERWSESEHLNPLVHIAETPRCEELTGVRNVLERCLLRALRDMNPTLRDELAYRLREGKDDQDPVGTSATAWFATHLRRNVVDEDELGLLRLAAFPRNCRVASSPLVPRNMAYVHRHLVQPGGFNVPLLTTFTVIIPFVGKDAPKLSRNPDGMYCGPWLDEDGIVRPGTVVSYGDVLVGLERARELEEPTPAERLVQAIFGKPREREDVSLRYNRRVSGLVLAVDILGSRQAAAKRRPYPGKHVRIDQYRERALVETMRIFVTILIEQSLGAGDRLYGDNQEGVIVCGILDDQTFARILGDNEGADVIVSDSHPWSGGNDLGGPLNSVLLRFNANSAFLKDSFSRSTEGYQVVTQQPVWNNRNASKARLDVLDFSLLLERNCPVLASELYAARCDVSEGRIAIVEQCKQQDSNLADDLRLTQSMPSALTDCLSETVRSWALHLQSLCIKAAILGGDGGNLSFQLMDGAAVLANSHGEVTKAETVERGDVKPIPKGLFCERIFGPVQDFKCACGKRAGNARKGKVCEVCGVEFTRRDVRRDRMGHVVLAIPVVHPWYLHGEPCVIGLLLGLTKRQAAQIAYYEIYLVIDPGTSPLKKGQVLTSQELRDAYEQHGYDGFEALTGGEAIRTALSQLKVSEEIRVTEDAVRKSGNKKGAKRLKERLKCLKGFQATNVSPEAMVLTILPVLPPERRPIVKVDVDKLVMSDLDDLYVQIIRRNEAARRQFRLKIPDIVLHTTGGFLQDAVDALFANEWRSHPATDRDKRPLVSLGDCVRGREATLLDGLCKRLIDYCARVRAVPANTGSVDVALLPERIAMDLFEPAIVSRLIKSRVVATVRRAYELTRQRSDHAYRALMEIAPRLTILVSFAGPQFRMLAFDVQIISEPALKLHPDLFDLVGWENAGEPVRVYSVLSSEGQSEARARLRPSQIQEGANDHRRRGPAKKKRVSPFTINSKNLAATLVKRAISGEQFPLGKLDRVILCMPPLPPDVRSE